MGHWPCGPALFQSMVMSQTIVLFYFILTVILVSQVFQRREDGSVDFYRGWNEYKNGFGNIAGEFWLGNKYLFEITQHGRFDLRVDLQDFDGESRFAKYNEFKILGENDKFKLILGTYSGNAGK